MKKYNVIFNKISVLELNDKSLSQINGGTLFKPQEELSNTSVSGPACTMAAFKDY